MASASSSASPQSQKKYDVFVSFRGEDTRTSIASHLRVALRDKEIHTSMDDIIEKGDELWPTLREAIENSSLYIVILSENYASSIWCLRELAEILDCTEDHEKGQRVIPVFYKVEPSDVRKQLGSYKKAFVKHERNKGISKQEVQKWRTDLTFTSNLLGWNTSLVWDDAVLVEKIVEDVISKLDKMFPRKSDLIKYVGIQEQIRIVELMLDRRSPEDVRLIGIWGVGGIGKTTLARVVFNKLRCEYEGYCFLKNVRGELKKNGISFLKEKLVSTLLGYKEMSIEISDHQKRRLAQTKILAVLDDVNDVEQIENLAEGRHCFGPGSRILITTRDLHVLSQKVDDIYKVQPLKPKEASRLFSRNAFKNDNPDKEFTDLAKSMVYHATGNPLVLTVLASSLWRGSQEEWESKLDKLKEMFDQYIHNVLKLSFEEQSDEEYKNIFMHNLVQEMGKEIILEESVNPKNEQEVRFLPKANISLIWDLVKDALDIVREGLKHKNTSKIVESTTKDLSPLVEKIEQSMKRMDLLTEQIEKLKEIISANKNVLGKRKIRWWNRILKPYYQSELSDEFNSLERFISGEAQVLMIQLLTEILSILSSQDPTLEGQTNSAQNSDYNRTPIFKGNLDEISSQFTVGLNARYVIGLKHKLLHGHEKVLNLYGLPGSGKTTLAKILCLDLQVKGKFKNNIMFETLGSQIQSIEAISRLQHELSKYRKNPVLLVLDDVWPDSENIVEELKHRSPDSRILMTSGAQIKTANIRYSMEPLCDEDAVELLHHWAQPCNMDIDDPTINEILFQIVKGCKGLPFAIEFIGRLFQGKGIDELLKVQLKLSRGLSILDPHAALFTRLQNCFDMLVDESIKECFMDLALFPEDQRIPVDALIDMWSEMYGLNDAGSIYAIMIIKKLIAMNLATGLQVRRIVGRDVDNYYNNHFLTQHNLFKELAIQMISEEPLENRRRLIIDMNGNHRPQGWPLQQQSVAAPIISISTDQNITPDWCNIHVSGAEVLVLNLKTTEYTLPEFINEMKNLKVLILTNYGFHFTELKKLELLGSLWALKRIRLQQVSVPYLREMKNVHKLSFYMCEVKKAFEDSSIDLSVAMPNLTDLNIDYCNDLVKLPIGLCDTVTLKNLNISNCHKYKGLPQEIGKLQNLESLSISYCAEFEKMPESITKLKNLQHLDISYCVSLGKLPDNIGKLQNLAKLYMVGCPIRKLPDSVMDFKNLESVRCDKYTYLLWEVIKSWLPGIHIKTTAQTYIVYGLPEREGKRKEVEESDKGRKIF